MVVGVTRHIPSLPYITDKQYKQHWSANMQNDTIKKPITFDVDTWAKLQEQAKEYGTTPSKALDFILTRYYKLQNNK